MEKNSKNVILLLGCWVLTAVLALIALIQLPAWLSERQRLSVLQQQLSNQHEIENRLRAFDDRMGRDIDSLKSQMAEHLAFVDQASFTCFPESEVNRFVEELQDLLARAGVSVENLAYKTRESRGEYAVLPFEIGFVSSFSGMREALYLLETHPAGILIEQLEFGKIDSRLGAGLKLRCSVRFKKNA